jgi:hypothetical protein
MDDKPTAPKNKVDFISDKLDGHIRTFSSAVTWYRNVYFGTSIATLVLSAFITIVAGWKQDPPPFKVENAILILGALITVVSGWGLFFSPKNSWLIFAASLNRLRALKSKIEFLKASPSTVDSDEKSALDIYAEYQAVLDAQNKAWLDLRSTSEPTLQDTRGKGPPSV